MKTFLLFLKRKALLLLSLFFTCILSAQTTVNIDNSWNPSPASVSKSSDLRIVFNTASMQGHSVKYVRNTDNIEVDLNATTDGNNIIVIVSSGILAGENNNLKLRVYKDNAKIKEFSIKLNAETPPVVNTAQNTQSSIPANEDLLVAIKIEAPTGRAFQDALLLRKAIEDKDAVLISKILKLYNSEATLESNDFLKSANASIKKAAEENTAAHGGKFLSFQDTKFGNLDVTKYANAMADIMIEHAKEELTIAFFDRFKKFVNDPKHAEFKVLFPKTCDKLENLLSYKYPEMIKALRVAFLDDIKSVALRVDDVLALEKYKEFTTKYPEITVAIRSLRLVYMLENGTLNASGVLSQMSKFTELNVPADNPNINLINIGSSIRVANLINESICHDESGQLVWHDSKHLIQLYNDEDLFRLYIGLIYEKGREIKFRKGPDQISFAAMLENHKTPIFFLQNKIQEFVDLTAKVKSIAKEINKKGETTTNEERYTYISTSIDVLEYGLSIYKFFDTASQVSDRFVPVLRLSNDIYKNIYEEEYNAAISNIMDLFESFADLSRTDRSASKTADNETVGTQLFDFVKKAKPYALFMANMVEAESEADIKAALEAVILPVGSSTIKKHSNFNFNVQSYLGARLSFTDAKNEAVENTWNDKFALSAPIGLSISYGFNGKGGSITLFVPLFDLGAVVDYKLKYKEEGTPNEELESKDYTIKLGQIISPGAYLVYGLPFDIPLSLGFGGQYGPGLSKIDENNSTKVSNPYWKWNAFLSVDIPLFNFINNPKNKK